MPGYIYIRWTKWWAEDGVCKLGKCENLRNREGLYITSEHEPGRWSLAVLVDDQNKIERKLQEHFDQYNYYRGAGTEYYELIIIDLLEDYLVGQKISYHRLTQEELEKLKYKTYPRKFIQRSHNGGHKKEQLIEFIPRIDQQEVINEAVKYFAVNVCGILLLICGVGKTLISLWVTQELNCARILICVPNLLLLTQWSDVIGILFSCIDIFKVCGNSSLPDRLPEKYIILSTYASVYKIKDAGISFDMKIMDEAHHLINTSTDVARSYRHALSVSSTRQLSLTATLKDSNDSLGDIITSRNLCWAIENNIICDYVIQVVKYTGEYNDLQLAALAALKTILLGYSHHVLIYSNNCENSQKIIEYLEEFDSSDVYFVAYHGDMSGMMRFDILDKFMNSNRGIISCVYCLGEGWDLPLLDGVVFAENMTSMVRIVQSALRSIRKDRNDSDKIAKIILPMTNDYRKVTQVINEMRVEDPGIISKIQSYSINSLCDDYDVDLVLAEEIRLITLNRASLGISYEEARKIISDVGVKNKAEYLELCERDIRLSPDPDELFGEKFTDWIEYLGIQRIYYKLDVCKKKVNEYCRNLPPRYDLSVVVVNLHKSDPLFPPPDLWIDYYKIANLRDLIEVNIRKKRTKKL